MASGARTSKAGTGYDVARRAGVSQSAVSRCFGRNGSVSPEMRRRVMRAAEELGYQPNVLASSLITGRSNMVAVVISQLTNLHYPEVLDALTQCLSARGLRVLLFALEKESDVGQTLPHLWSYRVDGAIVAAKVEPEHVAAFARNERALILYNRLSEGAQAASVTCDFVGGARLLVDGLFASGCRRFAVIGGPADSAVGEARVHGALVRLGELGLRDIPMQRGDFSYDGGARSAKTLLAEYSLDAIICANDTLALGALDVARLDYRMRVPGDLSVVGFDGVGTARWRSHRLTTIRQPVERMAEAAVEMLVARIANPALGGETRRFAGEFLAGDTADLSLGTSG